MKRRRYGSSQGHTMLSGNAAAPPSPLNPAKGVNKIDITVISGEGKGQRLKGVYQLDQDFLKIARADPEVAERLFRGGMATPMGC